MSRNSRLAMLRHFSPLPKRSTMTSRSWPASFNAAASTEPMKPPPPVTTSISAARALPRRRVLRAGRAQPGDRRRRRVPGDQLGQHDAAAGGLDLGGADHLVLGVVAALDQHVGFEPLDQRE